MRRKGFLGGAGLQRRAASSSMASAGRTFKVSEKQPEKLKKSSTGRDEHYLANLGGFRGERCSEVLQGTEWSRDTLHSSENGFVHGVVGAYNEHHNLVIRPDDVWLAITTQFGNYVNANSEDMRSIFVTHEGKKELTVYAIATLRTADYGWLAQAMTKELKANVKDDKLCDWVLPSFSTTTTNDTIVGSVALMATLKNYFSYNFVLMCGIPYVTLLGTTGDWEEIHRRVDELKKYGDVCAKWHDLLKPVTYQFVEASKGNVDLSFWGKVCHHLGGGSGPRYISGWITVFCVFAKDGKWLGHVDQDMEFPKIDTNDIPPGYGTVDVLVDDNGTKYQTMMFAGHMGYEAVDDGKGIAPKLSWAIALKDQAA